MPWRVKGKFLWIGEMGGFGKISFIALFYLYVNCGGRGIWCARRRGLCAFVEAACAACGHFACTRISADSVLELRRLVPLVGISLACAVDISTDNFAFIRDRYSYEGTRRE